MAHVSAARKEAARLWSDLVARHHRLRRRHLKWPSKRRWEQWGRGKYPGLSAQAAQQLIGEFCEAVASARSLRRQGHDAARYPWRKPRYHDVVYTNQDARLRNGDLVLPHGTSGTLCIPLSRDLMHKATRTIADVFPGATCFAGKPFNEAAQKMGRRHAQQVSSACNRQLLDQLDYKTCGAIQVDEHYTSQTCPGCGARNQGRRIYRCRQCGETAPRDVIGSVNILSIGRHHTLVPGRSVPNAVTWIHPVKYPGPKSGSTDGHSASRLGPPQEAPARLPRS